jgi:sulfur-oxidizing protein SoxY
MEKIPAIVSRRAVLQTGGALAIAVTFPVAASATPETMQEAIQQAIGKVPVQAGKVKLEIPPLVENGNTVSCMVTVDSPMTPDDYVKAIHVFNEKNPQPNVISVHLTPRCGRAKFATRIRLADTQSVTAIAELSNGTFWSDTVGVVITLGACLEN